jgi:hypothetical protein
MYKFLLLFAALGFLSSNRAFSQKQSDHLFSDPSPSLSSALSLKTSQYIESVSSGKLLSVNTSLRNEIYNNGGDLVFRIQAKTQDFWVEVQETNAVSSDFEVINSKGEKVDVKVPRFYKGKIKGNPNSFVSISVSPLGIEGLISSDELNYTLGKIKDSNTDLHIIYKSDDLPSNQPFECNVVEVDQDEIVEKENSRGKRNANVSSVTGCRAIEIYFEADYQMYLDHGSSISATSTYVSNLFNNVALLYANEGVNITLKTLKVWDTADPYRSTTNTLDALYLFDNINFSGTGADIAHLLSSRSIGGGRAYYYINSTPVYEGMTTRAVFRSCTREIAFGVSGNLSSTIIPIPSYSWNVMVVAHELGHNFGLPHTHSCTWPGGAIDGCSTAEGSCTAAGIPSDGGTIMSYCHQQSVGININKGFGLHPGNKMRAEVAAASCLGGTISTIPVAVSGSRCNSGSVTISATGCTGTYNWYATETGGTSLGSLSSFTTPSIPSTTTYYVNCTSPANCSGKRVPVNAIILASKPVASSVITCGENVVQVDLTASGCVGGTLEWFDVPTGGIVLETGGLFMIPGETFSRTFYVACNAGECSSERTQVNVTYLAECYCTTPYLNCTENDMITLVRIFSGQETLLNNSSTCSSSGYGDYTALNTILNIGNTYSITLNNPGFYQAGARVWIDYNGNGSFDTNEMIFSRVSNIWTTETQSFIIPSNVTAKPVLMRVKLEYNTSSINPCTNTSNYGETEDYVISLVNPTFPCPSVLTLTNPSDNYSSGSQVRKASSSNGVINASNKITGTAKVTYESKAINLTPGFTSNPGTVFLAKPGGCP